MFHRIPASVLSRMRYLESVDAADRSDDTPRERRLRQVSAETGKILAMLAATAPSGELIEVGTSGGYSALWISLGAASHNRVLTTYEIDPAKVEIARASFDSAGVAERIRLIHGDARQHISEHHNIGFCFLDAEKDVYAECYDLVVPRLVQGGLLVADNVISHADPLRDFIERVLSDEHVAAVQVPLGKGLLLCRRD